MQRAIQAFWKLPTPPEPPDVADALAIAICHLHTASTLQRQHATAR
jgi:crossover junction endodeoxyribonuclease RuvC